GQRMAQELGHNVTTLKPGLAGFDTASTLFQNLKEANIEETIVRIVDGNGAIVVETQGNILCSNGILRGTAIFDAVRQIAHKNISDFTAVADILPAVKPGTQGNLAALLAKCDIPQDLARNILARYGKMPAAIAKLKELPLEVTSIRPVKEAIVTAGGVALQEIEPATMASRKEDGLFFAGELMDIDGPTGGYNLHAAFATARLAIAEITRRIKGKQSKPNQSAPRFGGHNPKPNPSGSRSGTHTQDSPKRRYSDPRSSVWRGK
ncbi:MAG: NAD(P)/FAD-dependent oxidoreductase, partial [Victivallales bacterium]|nr:NAD(P)/FAD-dependent oxidoreductase [Victivallales bacterium]